MEQERKYNRKVFGIVEVLLLLFLTCFISFISGYFLLREKKPKSIKEDEYMKKFVENYEYITQNYYGEIDKNELIESAIKGMVESLGDDYSNFLDKNENNQFDISLKGEYEGLGISITKYENKITVLEVYDDTPAKKAGVEPFDTIKSIDDVTVTELQTSDVTKLIQQKSGNIHFVFVRNGEEKQITLKKEKISLQSVHAEMLKEQEIGYIKVDIFAQNTADQFTKTLKELEKNGMKGLIIDVRGNGGGHLSSAAEMSSALVDSSHVIYQVEAKGKTTKKYATGKETKKYPIVFLTDEESASGSELFVAAVKDNTNAKSVGKKTFGKGTVQELIPLTSNSEYKITVKKWLTPKGEWINGKGINPDIEVELSSAYLENPSVDTDNQLQKGIETVKEMMK